MASSPEPASITLRLLRPSPALLRVSDAASASSAACRAPWLALAAFATTTGLPFSVPREARAAAAPALGLEAAAPLSVRPAVGLVLWFGAAIAARAYALAASGCALAAAATGRLAAATAVATGAWTPAPADAERAVATPVATTEVAAIAAGGVAAPALALAGDELLADELLSKAERVPETVVFGAAATVGPVAGAPALGHSSQPSATSAATATSAAKNRHSLRRTARAITASSRPDSRRSHASSGKGVGTVSGGLRR